LVKIFLDARELEHPEPLTKAVEHLQSMRQDSYLYMINQKNPIPLLEIAKNNSFHTLSHEDKEGIWHIIISKNSSDLKGLLEDV